MAAKLHCDCCGKDEEIQHGAVPLGWGKLTIHRPTDEQYLSKPDTGARPAINLDICPGCNVKALNTVRGR